ncbi:MAG: hypothetical protein PHI28_09470 [Mangrovibacterium sp.]|nr:hypothetical protein [Mangrovibacterium sp.]
MKNKLLKVLLLLVLAGGVLYSCKEEIAGLFDAQAPDVDQVQSWYNANLPQGVYLKSAGFNGGRLYAKPDWKHAYKGKHEKFHTVEVPLSTQGRFGFAPMECKHAYDETGDRRYIRSLTQMVIVTEKENNKTYGFLMTIIPDKEYRDETKFKSYFSKYKKWQKEYSGYVFYHTLEGDFTNGWKLSDGKVTKSVKPKDGGDIGLHLKSGYTECTDYYWEQWYELCTDWYTETEWGSEYGGTTCEGPYVEYEYLYTECVWVEDPENPEDPGGGYIPPDPEPCTCGYCPICGVCLDACPGHSDSTFVNAVNNVMGLTSSNIKSGLTAAMSDGRITVNSSTSNPIFYFTFSQNAAGQWIYNVSINPNNLTNLDNGTKMIIAHEMFHFYKIETGPANQAGANDYHHSLMVLEPDYRAMLKEIFPGFTEAEYDMLRFAGTLGSPIFDDLPQAERTAIIDFFITNGIYYQ